MDVHKQCSEEVFCHLELIVIPREARDLGFCLRYESLAV